ncbi:hypothetical protein EV200_101447 [Pedobacter psychrotolerans]|uniref:Uncharacterized protein n=1 Tax=Pedobacter psychrotolerans TaxID=1843235 RepID=A0A4R2HQE7_9SPHI|nr:hypothetical protein [Pedobacter psychrotolerans]TCO31001.1 hypothetical protein EV200_101447 [Pedobacter psychrotolerans]GGE42898.1 hypothetical protein GCM10011413_06100 [Pedobacter psychrotolerans]
MSAEFKDYQTPKNLVNIITFNVTDTKSLDGGIVPWVNIGHANEEILNLVDADEIVIPEHDITISIDYPLQNPETFQFYSSIGFSRKLLLIEIREKFLELSTRTDESFDSNAFDLVALDVYKTDAGKIEITLDLDA